MTFFNAFLDELQKISRTVGTPAEARAAKRSDEEYFRQTGMPVVGPNDKVPVSDEKGFRYVSIDKARRVPKILGGTGFEEVKTAAKKSHLDKMQPLTPAEREAANKRYAEAKKRFGSGDGCSPGKSAKGYRFHTHRASTGWYPSFDKIPLDKIRFVASTA